MREHEEGWKRRNQEVRDEKEMVVKEWEKCRKEIDNLRELVKLKDR